MILLEALSVPVIFAPVAVITTTLALPIEEIFTLPSAAGIFTFELPLANLPTRFPAATLPLTDKEDKVPVLVILGCSLVVTVAAVIAVLA